MKSSKHWYFRSWKNIMFSCLLDKLHKKLNGLITNQSAKFNSTSKKNLLYLILSICMYTHKSMPVFSCIWGQGCEMLACSTRVLLVYWRACPRPWLCSSTALLIQWRVWVAAIRTDGLRTCWWRSVSTRGDSCRNAGSPVQHEYWRL